MNALPGRLRITTPHLKGQEEVATEVREFLLEAKGITGVSVTLATGTLLVNHDDTIQTEGILDLLRSKQYICKSLGRNKEDLEHTIVEAEEEEDRRLRSMAHPLRRRTDMESLRRRRTDAASCYMHAVPGRLRLTSDYLKGYDKKAEEVREILLATKGITDVSVSVATGSLTIHHDEDTIPTREILAILGDRQLKCKFVTTDRLIEDAVLETEKIGAKALLKWLLQAALAAVGLRYLAKVL